MFSDKINLSGKEVVSMDKAKFVLNLLLILAVTGIVVVALMVSNNHQIAHTFSVKATGEVFAKADVANLTLGFKTKVMPTAVKAVNQNAEKMNRIVKELEKIGIQGKDIKTVDYSLNPIYDWSHEGGQRLKGYQVSQKLKLKIHALDKIGQIIAQTTEQGANQIGQITFSIDDQDELKTQARNQAIAKAKQKAKQIAQVSGIKLGKLINVIEKQSYYPQPVYDRMALDSLAAPVNKIEIPKIETGQNEVKVEINLVYEVK